MDGVVSRWYLSRNQKLLGVMDQDKPDREGPAVSHPGFSDVPSF